jgi:hypothetical protein
MAYPARMLFCSLPIQSSPSMCADPSTSTRPRHTLELLCNGMPRARLASKVISSETATMQACRGWDTEPDDRRGTAGEDS